MTTADSGLTAHSREKEDVAVIPDFFNEYQ